MPRARAQLLPVKVRTRLVARPLEDNERKRRSPRWITWRSMLTKGAMPVTVRP